MAKPEVHNAILLAENNLQSILLKESIEQKVNLNIKLISPERLNVNSLQNQDLELIIIDFPTMSKQCIERYQELRDGVESDVHEVLLNTPHDFPHSEMLKWQSLIGIFYASDTLEKLVSGFNCILQGEMWMSRKLIYQYIRFYRERQCAKTSPHYLKLTKREQQIIKLLGDGASNTQIADTLYVSENTVKAHLHNTFKKIKVKNRLQALIWVNNNIATSEFVQ
ncbi:LuxR C-terminal-related transcriptional regulator [Vibrio splendidus]|uniref:LuxR C-terminal-related transcriptional regulator n=1 Tax=Vibrio splendidus TaxID=29497 RepID=UPI0009767A0D|nr:LuxR C-terminal-related transcriptional regulator [Vibrio splendidus]OMO24328.1 helix-turn-helix transcriptional regulator [Vibrio splendidus]PMI80961.1 helix-turn-helix transcriptional regulator [Vibrio splendidus]PMK15590.1 helix-turn-helix transcriptional regulator [Vibrio splendidus]PMK61439.1 helix-turn-helix transcriptional regulator [Vibrio splendidus]